MFCAQHLERNSSVLGRKPHLKSRLWACPQALKLKPFQREHCHGAPFEQGLDLEALDAEGQLHVWVHARHVLVVRGRVGLKTDHTCKKFKHYALDFNDNMGFKLL